MNFIKKIRIQYKQFYHKNYKEKRQKSELLKFKINY